MFLLKRKRHKIEQLIYDYLDLASKCVESCKENFEYYLQTCRLDESFFTRICGTHSFESKSDDKRKEIEYMMYHKSLIPESRGDILGLLEAVDKIPNKSESVLSELYKYNIVIPESYKDQFDRLFHVNIDAAILSIKIIYKYFESHKEINAINNLIDALESKADVMQIKITRGLFLSDIADLDKILLNNLIIKICQISDHAENIGDRVKLLSVKTIF